MLFKMSKMRQLNNKGMTLVEMIVSFMLLSIFMISATMLITSVTNVYYNVKGVATGLEVSNVIHNKIRGELEDAINNVKISADGSKIDFIKTNESHVYLSVLDRDGKKSLTEYYYEVPATVDEDGETGTDGYDAVDWMFDKAVYMGYEIESLQFDLAGSGYDKNILKVDLVIKSPKYGSYTTSKYVKCYNFEENTSYITKE